MKKIKNRFFKGMSESELHNELEEEIAARKMAEEMANENSKESTEDGEGADTDTDTDTDTKAEKQAETATEANADVEVGAEADADVRGEAKELNELKVQLAKSKDDYVRLVAEFDNYRRRVSKEKLELISTASEGVIKAILPIVDDFERAMQALDESNDGEHAKEGTKLIYKKLLDMLKSQGVSEIEALGQELDTDLHEAVAQFATDDKKKKGKIIDVTQKGYKLGDKVIRFAKVVIGI